MVRNPLAVLLGLLSLYWHLSVPVALSSVPVDAHSKSALFLNHSLDQFDLRRSTLESAFAICGKHDGSREIGSNFETRSFQTTKRKSKGRAFLQSLILPGWGQHYAASKIMFKFFAATEVLLLGTFVGFNVWSNWLEDDFRTFAVTHAEVNLKGKPDRYFVDIGNFDDIFAFNQAQLRDRDVAGLYKETDVSFWRWDSESNRREFESMRIRSDRAANRADLSLAAIFLNHLLSAIHSTLAVHKFNKHSAGEQLGMKLNFDLDSRYQALTVNLAKHF